MTQVRRLGVVGAGTMGAGIAQVAAESGLETLMHDPVVDVDARIATIADRWQRKGRQHALPVGVSGLADLADCDVIIEAVPERLEVKQALFAELSRVAPEAILASNTSSIPITAIAASALTPGRVVGMHFFNPPPLMRLVEVIPAVQSFNEAVALIVGLGKQMGKHVIVCRDVAGFVVNRTNRPFVLEALRLLQQQVADVATIDRIVRLGAGFRLGPFELQDLIGIDVGFDVALSFERLSFGEPRWRPSPLSAQMVAAGWLGRKTSRGWYSYDSEGNYRPDDPEAPPGGGPATIVGAGPVADALRARAAGAGGPRIVVEGLGGTVDGEPFHAIVPLQLVEVTGEVGERVFASLGLYTARIADAPGGVLGRIVCQLVNEAHFTLGENVASAADIDAGMMLGVNHPRGPLAWGDLLGLAEVRTVLAALRELDGDAYRAAPRLMAAQSERSRRIYPDLP